MSSMFSRHEAAILKQRGEGGGTAGSIPGYGVHAYVDGLGSVCLCVLPSLELAEEFARVIRDTTDLDRGTVRIDGP